MNRRQFLRFIGTAAGAVAALPFIPKSRPAIEKEWHEEPVDLINQNAMATGEVWGKSRVDLHREAQAQLSNWWSQKIDEVVFNHLSSGNTL